MRACKILAITECLNVVLTYTARYDSLWLRARYGYLQDMATCEILLPERYGDLRDIASYAIWLAARYGSLQDISFKQIPISSDLTYPATLPTPKIWLPA